jgi:hypothetical protein
MNPRWHTPSTCFAGIQLECVLLSRDSVNQYSIWPVVDKFVEWKGTTHSELRKGRIELLPMQLSEVSSDWVENVVALTRNSLPSS